MLLVLSFSKYARPSIECKKALLQVHCKATNTIPTGDFLTDDEDEDIVSFTNVNDGPCILPNRVGTQELRK